MSIKEKLVNSTLKEFESIEELERSVASNDKCICDLYGKYEELNAKYNQLRNAIVGLGRKLGVELILDEEDEQIRILSEIVYGKDYKKWVTPEELNK